VLLNALWCVRSDNRHKQSEVDSIMQVTVLAQIVVQHMQRGSDVASVMLVVSSFLCDAVPELRFVNLQLDSFQTISTMFTARVIDAFQ
jgi:hypothetical protein